MSFIMRNDLIEISKYVLGDDGCKIIGVRNNMFIFQTVSRWIGLLEIAHPWEINPNSNLYKLWWILKCKGMIFKSYPEKLWESLKIVE